MLSSDKHQQVCWEVNKMKGWLEEQRESRSEPTSRDHPELCDRKTSEHWRQQDT